MGTRLNRYYNNPNIGAAMENIAGIFAPPSAQEIAGYAQAKKLQTENEGLEALMQLSKDPNADPMALDRAGWAAGQWGPTSGIGARDMGDATNRYGIDTTASTTRRGQDVTASTTLATNAADNKRAAITSLFGARDQNYDQPAVPDEFMDAIGLPGVEAMPGRDKPLGETEFNAAILGDAYDSGMIGPKDAADRFRGGIPIEQVIGADMDGDGTRDPVNVARGDAIGRQPYDTPGSAPARTIKTYVTPESDGSRKGTAIFDPATGWMTDEATGERLPQGTITGDITDTQSGMTASTNSDVQKTGMAINDTKATVQRLQTMIQANPGSTGIAGMLRGTVQDVLATGDDLAQQWGGQIAEMQAAVAADPALAAVVGPEGFDPSIPAIDMQATLLAFQLAKVLAGGDRISNQQFDFARGMVGSSALLANTSTSAAKLGEITQFLDGMAQRRENVQASPIARVGEQLDANAPAAPGAAGTTPAGTRWRVVQ
jgi:hypothetical protein